MELLPRHVESFKKFQVIGAQGLIDVSRFIKLDMETVRQINLENPRQLITKPPPDDFNCESDDDDDSCLSEMDELVDLLADLRPLCHDNAKDRKIHVTSGKSSGIIVVFPFGFQKQNTNPCLEKFCINTE